MHRAALALALALCAAAPALAQGSSEGDGLPLPVARSVEALLGEQVLQGRLEWEGSKSLLRLGDYYLVTDDGRRYRAGSSLKNQALRSLTHGWLQDERVTLRARVASEDGVLTAEVLEAINPAPRELRATVAEDDGALMLVTGEERLQVRDAFTGPRLVRPLVGKTVDVKAFVFQDGTTLVRAVKARARSVHFQPIVFHPGIMIPRWKRAGTEYWVGYRSEDGQVTVGVRHLDASKLDFESPAPSATPTAAVGLADQVPSGGGE
jgi:hypothetical protein